MMRSWLFLIFVLSCRSSFAQYTHADSLRGNTDSEGRRWWDVKSYELSVRFQPGDRFIIGSNRIAFTVDTTKLSAGAEMQIDLQEPMVLDSVEWSDGRIAQPVRKDGNAYFLSVPKDVLLSAEPFVIVYFFGRPRVAVNPPWDGGVIWAKDKNGKPWISVACQGLGASVWYPCKDSQSDEPESATMHFSCPDDLVCVSNGRFLGKELRGNHTAVYSWHVSSPINNYNIIPYIGDYVNIHEHFPGENGMLELDYWVLRGNEKKAEEHFADVPRTIEALEYWFGPYPFYEDGYKLVEAPHLGMEHQSAIAYGNNFKKGYNGTDLSGTGIGLNWDYIIVHESGHEWFGNNITTADIADMWVHEAFTDYSETLFTEYWYGKEQADKYVRGLRRNIRNDKPVTGDYGVNSEGSGDMYYKGANMLHTIRQLVNNDSLFREMLRGLNATFYHQVVTGREVEEYMSEKLGIDLGKVFDQYLRAKNPPVLEVQYRRRVIKYRWTETVPGFNMPVGTNLGVIHPGKRWKKIRRKAGLSFNIDPNYYVQLKTRGAER